MRNFQPCVRYFKYMTQRNRQKHMEHTYYFTQGSFKKYVIYKLHFLTNHSPYITPHIMLCHFFSDSPPPMCHSLKRQTMAGSKRKLFCIYGCLSISYYIKGDRKDRKLQCARTFTHRHTCINKPCRQKYGIMIVWIW